ncbi:MAG TPA: AAA family ATPase, partial [Chitinispirillaceae bacterium]|nr:AAA family ATPase [Chitinispirillaceae bacterium]
MQTIDILIGLPGAGKTTYARNYTANNPGWMIISVDNIREMLYGKYHYDEKDQLLVQRITGRTVKEILRYGYDLIIDDSILILTKAARRELVCS